MQTYDNDIMDSVLLYLLDAPPPTLCKSMNPQSHHTTAKQHTKHPSFPEPYYWRSIAKGAEGSNQHHKTSQYPASPHASTHVKIQKQVLFTSGSLKDGCPIANEMWGSRRCIEKCAEECTVNSVSRLKRRLRSVPGAENHST